MIDFTWKIFSQTGNIETYLLLKEMESKNENADEMPMQSNNNYSALDTSMHD